MHVYSFRPPRTVSTIRDGASVAVTLKRGPNDGVTEDQLQVLDMAPWWEQAVAERQVVVGASAVLAWQQVEQDRAVQEVQEVSRWDARSLAWFRDVERMGPARPRVLLAIYEAMADAGCDEPSSAQMRRVRRMVKRLRAELGLPAVG